MCLQLVMINAISSYGSLRQLNRRSTYQAANLRSIQWFSMKMRPLSLLELLQVRPMFGIWKQIYRRVFSKDIVLPVLHSVPHLTISFLSLAVKMQRSNFGTSAKCSVWLLSVSTQAQLIPSRCLLMANGWLPVAQMAHSGFGMSQLTRLSLILRSQTSKWPL